MPLLITRFACFTPRRLMLMLRPPCHFDARQRHAYIYLCCAHDARPRVTLVEFMRRDADVILL